MHWSPYDSVSKNRAHIIQTFTTIILMMVCVAFVVEFSDSYLRVLAEQVWIYGFIGMMAFILLSLLYESVSFCK